SYVRRSTEPTEADTTADVILLDTIGELARIYSLAEVVFVGGSMIPHGGQNILEPAASGKAVICGAHMFNFAEATRVLLEHDGLVHLADRTEDAKAVDELFLAVSDLLEEDDERRELGQNAAAVMKENRGATDRVFAHLRRLVQK